MSKVIGGLEVKIADLLEKYHPITKKQAELIETIENYCYESFEGRDSLDAKQFISHYMGEMRQHMAENDLYYDYGLEYDVRYYRDDLY